MKILKTVRRGERRWCYFLCDCGKKKWARKDHMKVILGCGCRRNPKTHGLSKTKTYACWEGMIQRCTNPKFAGYKNWGGRGIKVCKSWRKFENFVSHMGLRPKGLDLSRIDNDGDYEPGNCRWESRKANLRNTRRTRFVEWKGKRMSIAELAERTGHRYLRLWYRIVKFGWPVDTAVKLPPNSYRRVWATMTEVK